MENVDPDRLLLESADTSAAELQRIAASRPDLHPLIARHPNAYPALLEWLASLNDPQVNQALRERQALTVEPSDAGAAGAEHYSAAAPAETVVMPPTNLAATAQPTQQFTQVGTRQVTPDPTQPATPAAGTAGGQFHTGWSQAQASDQATRMLPGESSGQAATASTPSFQQLHPFPSPTPTEPASPQRSHTGRTVGVTLLILVALSAAVFAALYFFTDIFAGNAGKPVAQSGAPAASAASSMPTETSSAPASEEPVEVSSSPIPLDPQQPQLTDQQAAQASELLNQHIEQCLADTHFAPAGCPNTLYVPDPAPMAVTEITRTLDPAGQSTLVTGPDGSYLQLSGGTLTISYQQRMNEGDPWVPVSPFQRTNVFDGVKVPVSVSGGHVTLDFSHM